MHYLCDQDDLDVLVMFLQEVVGDVETAIGCPQDQNSLGHVDFAKTPLFG